MSMLHTIFRYTSHYALAVLLSLYACVSVADVVLPNSRIVFDASKRAKQTELINKSTANILMQLWISTDMQGSGAGKGVVPFMVTPPIFKLGPEAQQKVNIAFTGQGLPQDRESLYWFHYKEIPVKSAIPAPTQVQFSIENTVKLFYRPKGIKADVNKLNELITFTLAPSSGRGKTLIITNPTGYHLTFGEAEITINTSKVAMDKAVMISPFSHVELAVPASVNAAPSSPVTFVTINDFGGKVEHLATIK